MESGVPSRGSQGCACRPMRAWTGRRNNPVLTCRPDRPQMERASNRFGILALHALIWTLPFGLYYVFEQPSYSQSFYFQVGATTLALFYFGMCWIGGQLHLPRNGVLGAGLLLGLFAALSSLSSRSSLFTLKETAFLWSGLLVLAMVAHLRLDERQCRGLLASVVLVAALCALYGVLQYLGFDIRWKWIGYAEESKIGKYYVLSLLGHPNYLAAFIGPALMLCIGLAAGHAGRPMQTLLLVAGVILALCLLVAGSRSGWLAALVVGGGLAAVTVAHRRSVKFGRRALIFAAVAVCVMMLFAVPNPLVPRRYSFSDRLFAARPVMGRMYFYVAAARMIAQHPVLGVGYGNFGAEFWDYAAQLQDPRENPGNEVFAYILEDLGGIRPDQVHNEYLQIAAETGVLGLGAFFLLLVVFFRGLCRDYGVGRSLRERLLIASMGGAVGFLLIDCLFSFPLRLPCSALVFWLVMGVGSRYGQTVMQGGRNRTGEVGNRPIEEVGR